MISINEQFNSTGANSIFNMVHGLLRGQTAEAEEDDPIITNTNHRKVVTEIQPHFQIQGLSEIKKAFDEEDARSIRRSN